MNIKTYNLNFSVSTASFKELSEYDRGILVRDFSEYMRVKGAELSFLASDVQLISSLEDKDVQKT